MTNPARSAQHFAKVSERRIVLRNAISPLIPGDKPFVWEVGCGHGHFLAAYAAAHPRTTCIGIDIIRDRISRALRKRERAKLNHLHFVHAEANDFLEALPRTATFSVVFILFPDPWPKRRHHKNRLLQSLFFDQVHTRAGEQTRIYFRTDHEPYFSEVSATVESHFKWQLVDEPWPFELETVFQARAANYRSLIAAPKFFH